MSDTMHDLSLDGVSDAFRTYMAIVMDSERISLHIPSWTSFLVPLTTHRALSPLRRADW